MKELENIDLYKRLEKLDKDFASQLKKTALKIKELINKKQPSIFQIILTMI